MKSLCGEDCTSRKHVLIEKDYEGSLYVWGVMFGEPHNVVADTLKQPIAEYNETVDDESTFYLSSVKFFQSHEIASALLKEVEASEAEMRDTGEEEGGS